MFLDKLAISTWEIFATPLAPQFLPLTIIVVISCNNFDDKFYDRKVKVQRTS